MENQKETRLRILAEGGSIEICSIYKGNNDGFDYFVETSEDKPDGEEFPINVPTIHESFYCAFDELNEKYPWYKLHLDFVDEDFAEDVAVKLVENLNNPFGTQECYRSGNFEEKLGITLSKKEIPTKTGFSEIQVSGLTKETNYFYQEFYDDYAKEINQKFKLDSTQEIWSTFRSDTFNFIGTLEVSGNAILLRNEEAEICHILPVDKYKIVAKAEMGWADVWAYELK